MAWQMALGLAGMKVLWGSSRRSLVTMSTSVAIMKVVAGLLLAWLSICSVDPMWWACAWTGGLHSG